MKKKVSVIGAGVAGLATAIRLQNEGYEVTIYEKESLPGGKMHQIKRDRFTFDLGPTIVMMPSLYKEIFELTGRDPDEYIPMERIDPMYTAYFGQNNEEKYSISTDLVSLTETNEQISDEDAEGFLAYLSDIYKRFNIAKDHFLQKPFRKASDFYNLTTLIQALKLRTFDSASHSIGKFIKDDKLKQMLSFQTLYIGISPTDGPSLYSIIPMIELLYGIWFIKGGMYSMAKGMAETFLEMGGSIQYDSLVDEILIEESRATGIRVNGENRLSDFVLCNADFPYAMKHLVKDSKAKGKYTDKKIDQMDYSCSCYVMYWGVDKKVDELEDIHSFFFSEELDKNMSQIFSGERLTDPSFYVYIGSKIDETLAPKGKDGLYILIPVSELSTAKYEWNDETENYYREKVIQKLSKIKGLENIENEIITETSMTPENFKDKFYAYNGATFGLRPTLLQSNHFRPQAKAKHCENLYFTGSSTHPGAGVPIVLLSAKLASEELMKDDK